MADIIELTKDELETVGSIQYLVTSRYVGKPNDLAVLSMLRRELSDRLAEAGFISEITFKSDGSGNILPLCTIVGRVEKVDFDPERATYGR